jgi:lactate permease
LIANTAPVAYGALGSPVIALAAVTGLDLLQLSAMIGRQLPFFSVLVPFWLIWAFAGFKGMKEIWPAILVAGVSFAVPQYLVSNYHGPWLVDVVAAMVSMAAWSCSFASGIRRRSDPRQLKGHEAQREAKLPRRPAAATGNPTTTMRHDRRTVIVAWIPWMILTVFVFVWGVPQFKSFMDGVSVFRFLLEGLQHGAKCRRWSPSCCAGSRGLLAELAVGNRHRHPAIQSLQACS